MVAHLGPTATCTYMKLSMGGVTAVLAAMSLASVGCAPGLSHRAASSVEMVSMSPSQLPPAMMDDTELHAMIGTTEITSGEPLPEPTELPGERLPVAVATWGGATADSR